MILDTTSMTLQATLAGAVSTTPLDVNVFFRAWNDKGEETKPALQRSTVSSATAVNILTAPQQNYVREAYGVTIYNADTTSATVTVRTDNTTSRILAKQTLTTGQGLYWEKAKGWYIL